MSSWVTTGAAPPRLSCTCGPVGHQRVRRAPAPRFGFTIWTSRLLPSGSHCTSDAPPPPTPPRPPPPPKAPPITPLRRTPSTLCVFPVAVSPIHSSMPRPVVLVNAKCVPSGLQRPALSFGLGGSVHLDLGAFGNLAQHQRAVEGRVVQAVGFGIDPHARPAAAWAAPAPRWADSAPGCPAGRSRGWG